jgi:NADH-quinone oxidoreductase subunit L
MFVGAIFFPLLGASISGFLGRWIGPKAAQWSTVVCMVLAAICGVLAFGQVALSGQPTTIPIVTWMDVGGLEMSWALRYDTLSVVMVAMVTFISTLIHLYSVGYMSHDETPARFFAWEGVGLASYLLIGYWYDRESANRAAIKAFIVNRVGDVFFVLGVALIFLVFGSIEFDVIFATVPQHLDDRFAGVPALELICVLLFLGACGKSAQLAADGVCADRTRHRHRRRRQHRAVRRHGRLRPERHQAGHRLFDLLAARLHVLRRRRRRLQGGNLPPFHPRLLQGPAVPRRRQRDPRHVG